MIVDRDELREAAVSAAATPVRVFLERTARCRFDEVASAVAALGGNGLTARAAYSVKTNPAPEFVASARASGMLAETIGPEELALAARCGFAEHETIYNGPFALEGRFGRPRYAFADSPGAFARYVTQRLAGVPGVRLRPPGVDSRFGVLTEELPQICAIASEAHLDRLALSFHVRSEDIPAAGWPALVACLLHAGRAIEAETGCPIVALDVGGGQDPDAFDRWLRIDVPPELERVRNVLPNVREVIVEPGQEVATPFACLVMSVLEVRLQRRPREIVVDASSVQLPYREHYRHPLFALSDAHFGELAAGDDRILGAACLEDDVIAKGIRLPDGAKPGDRIVVGACGSYDASMTPPFTGGAISAVRPRLHDVPRGAAAAGG